VWGEMIQGQASMSSSQNDCTRAPDWRSGGGCRGWMRSLAGSRVAAIAGRRGWPRFRRGATEVSACGGGYGRKGASRRLAAICGRSDHQIDGDLVIPPFQRCPRSRLDRGSSRNGGLPLSTVAKVGIKTIASRQPADFGDRW